MDDDGWETLKFLAVIVGGAALLNVIVILMFGIVW